MGTRHNVFVSYYHDEDQGYKGRFIKMMGEDMVDKSVNLGGIIGNNPPTETVLQEIREKHIAQVSVTVVLIGRCTWQRKYVDWEIGASLRDTRANPRCGLLGILLPTHPDFQKKTYNPRLIPPRLADNSNGEDSFASICDWSGNATEVRRWIHGAFLRRKKQPDPDISLPLFGRNWSGDCARGWQL